MSNLVKYENEDPFAELARDAGPGRFLKFVQGTYTSDGEEIAIGTRCGAFVDELSRVWVKFVDGGLVEKRTYFVRDMVKPPEREDMPDLDTGYWGRDKSGHPKNPWSLQWVLPLQKIETGERLTFVTNSKGGDEAVRNLVAEYVRRRPSLPVIMLRASKYPNKRYGGFTHIPLLPVVRWTGESAPQTNKLITAVESGVIDPAPLFDDGDEADVGVWEPVKE